MTALATPGIERRRRGVAFRIVAGALAVALFALGGVSLLAPWVDLTGYRGPEYHASIHRWHDAQRGALVGVLLAGSLLWLSWRPRAHQLLRFLGLAAALLGLIGALFDPRTLAIVALPAALCIAVSPDRSALLGWPGMRGWSRSLLALSLAAAALLAPEVWGSLLLQVAGSNAHAQQSQWVAAMLPIALTLGGALAAAKGPGWPALALLVGAALIYLGLVAVVLPAQPGSWGYTGGALATIGGWAFVGATAWEARRPARGAA